MLKLGILILTIPTLVFAGSKYGSIIEVACPNEIFLIKHFPTGYQDTKEDAAKFAVVADRDRRRMKLQITEKDSVFLGDPATMTYTTEVKWSKVYCKFLKPVSKYNCNLQKDKFGNPIFLPNGDTIWSCYYLGKFYAYHAESNGHYEHKLDIKA
jgi:hypothetical protein